jgi:excisionase family DNA binding protein
VVKVITKNGKSIYQFSKGVVSMKHLTTGQAAKRLGVHIGTVRRMVARGELRGAKIGANLRVNEADVAKLEKAGN